MTLTLKGQFETRREAEMTVERLVQEYGVDRGAIVVAAAGDENSAGVERAGSDEPSGAPSEEPRDDAALEGAIVVMVELDNDAQAEEVSAAFCRVRRRHNARRIKRASEQSRDDGEAIGSAVQDRHRPCSSQPGRPEHGRCR